jgi:hypothetical protein
MGLAEVQRNLNAAIRRIEQRTASGVLKAAYYVVGKAKPRTPIEFGFLRNSYQVTSGTVGNNPIAVVANTQAYAPFVHEDMTARHPRGGEAKFLERTVEEESSQIVSIIANESRIK